MQFIFDADVAEEIGLNGAIILNNIAYWVGRNAANGINFHDGCYWTFNSLEAFQKMFHFWSERTIQRTLHSLEDGGYIKSGCFNKDPRDLTKWYTVTEKGWEILPVSDVTKAKKAEMKPLTDWIRLRATLPNVLFIAICVTSAQPSF